MVSARVPSGSARALPVDCCAMRNPFQKSLPYVVNIMYYHCSGTQNLSHKPRASYTSRYYVTSVIYFVKYVIRI